MGLSYKPNVGDLRESPAIDIINQISKKNLKKTIYINDPFLSSNIFKNFKNIKKSSIKSGILKSQIIIILVAHNEYKNINKLIKNHHFVYDAVNIIYNSNRK